MPASHLTGRSGSMLGQNREPIRADQRSAFGLMRSEANRWSMAAAFVALLLPNVSPVLAQAISGRVFERESGDAVVGAFIAVFDANGVPASRGEFSNRSGAFLARLPQAGRYRIRVEALGFEPLEFDSVLVAGGNTVAVELGLQQSPVALDPLEVRAAPLSLEEELTITGARRRHAGAPAAGPVRVFMEGDPEMRSALDVSGLIRWVPSAGAPCRVWFMNGFKSEFPIADMPANWFEAIEVYRRDDLVPGPFRNADTFGCEVIAVWSRPGGSKLSMGRVLGLGAVVGLILLIAK